jgi:hypothetical protein
VNKNEIPQSQKLFLDRKFLEEWNNSRYEIHYSPNKPIRVIIFGEDHQRQQQEQVDFINISKPKYLLHEGQGGWIFDPNGTKTFIKPQRRLFDNVGDNVVVSTVNTTRFQNLSKKMGFKIIGCDLTNAEIIEKGKRLSLIFPQQYQYEEVSNSIWRTDDNYHRLSWEELTKDKNIMFYRDSQMVKTIKKYEALSEKPIVVIMGGAHGDDIHENKMLQHKKFGYAYIKQYAGKIRLFAERA